MKECILWSEHEGINVILDLLKFDGTPLDDLVFALPIVMVSI